MHPELFLMIYRQDERTLAKENVRLRIARVHPDRRLPRARRTRPLVSDAWTWARDLVPMRPRETAAVCCPA